MAPRKARPGAAPALGRMLTKEDFVPATLTPDLLYGCQNTPRLLSRVGVTYMAICGQPLPDHLVDKWFKAFLTNAIERSHPDIKEVEVDGDEIILVYERRGELEG
jgi:hypothetical protein